METTEVQINGNSTNIIDWHIEKPKAALLIVHGYAEHAARYDHVAKFFNSNGYAVQSYDLKGHGTSAGIKAYIENFDEYVDELEEIAKLFCEKYADLPVYILGHSMGGLIVGINAAKEKLARISKVVLSNPAFDIESNQPKILVSLVRFLSKFAPKLKTVKLDSKFISRDADVRNKYNNDPLVYRGGSKPGMVNEFDNAGKWLRENASSFKNDVLLNYSKADRVVYPFASEKFFKKISSTNKKLIEYPGLYHELLNEPEQKDVMNNILKWCEKNINR